MLRYKSCKKDLHRDIAAFIPTHLPVMTGADNTLLTEQLLRHMLIAQDCKEEKDLNEERRAALVVLRVSNIVNRNLAGYIFADQLLLQCESYNRVVVLTKDDLKWLRNPTNELLKEEHEG